jgi:hypothetical protein
VAFIELLAGDARQIGAEDDLTTQIYWRVPKAQVAADRGEPDEASRLASEMLELVVSSEGLDLTILTLEVARFLAPDAAKQALKRALTGALAKGNVVTAAQARAQLEAL